MNRIIRAAFSRLKTTVRPCRRARTTQPGLEPLEPRLTPYFGATTYLWTAMGDQTTWNDPLNWSHVDPLSFTPVSGSPTPGSNVVFPSRALLPKGSPTAINLNFSDINMPLASLTIEDTYTFTGNSIQVDSALSMPNSYAALAGSPTATFMNAGIVLAPGVEIETAANTTLQIASPTNPTGLVLTIGGAVEKTGEGRLIIDTQTVQYANSASVQPIPFDLLGGVTELGASVSLTGVGFQVGQYASLQTADNTVVTLGPISGTGTIELLGTSAVGDTTALSIFVSAALVDSFTGSIIGQGQLATVGFGTLVLSSIDFAGAGTVVARSGTLDVNGPISAGGLSVGTLGTLGGLGEWSISGSVAFQTGSTLDLTIDGTTPGSGYTQIADASASGVDLGGARLTASLGYEYQVGDQLTIISSPAVTGSFANVVAGVVLLGPSVPFAVGSTGGVTISPLRSITTTSLASVSNPSHPGLPVTIVAAVSTRTASVSNGVVNFVENGNVVATVPVSNGQTTYTTSFPTIGDASFQAVYLGDGPDQASASGVITQAIVPYATTTVIASSLDPSSLGDPVSLVAQVTTAAGPVTTGSVAFRQGSRLLGVETLNGGGFASLVMGGLTVGTARIQAIYQGSVNDLSSVSAVLAQRVLPAATTTALAVESFRTRKGALRYELAASVANSAGLTPLGIVVFKKDGRVIAQSRLANGQAVFLFGPHAIPRGRFVAYYRGAPRFQASVSGVIEGVG